MISVLGQCASCCTCPDGFARVPDATVSVTCASLTAVPTLCGFSGYDDGSYDAGNPELWEGQGKKWKTRTLSGGSKDVGYAGADCSGICVGVVERAYSGSVVFDEDCDMTSTGAQTLYTGDVTTCPDAPTFGGSGSATSIQIFYGCQDPFTDHSTLTVKTTTACPSCISGSTIQTYDAAETLSNADTVAAAIARASSPTSGTACCAETGEIDVGELTEPESTTPITLGSSTSVTLTVTITGLPETEYIVRIRYSNTYDGDPTPDTYDTLPAVETDEYGVAEFEVEIPEPVPLATRCFVSAEILSEYYEIAFPTPTSGAGTCYHLTWTERFIDASGESVDTVSVYSAGVYRPTVTLSAPPAGGVQAHARAVMSSTGTISSISILHPGSGYTSAPTVTVEAAINGGTSSTGWVATLTAGQVTAIGSGSAGDYRPTLEFTGDGTGATATCTLDAVGGIAAVSVGAGGADYTATPTLTITEKVASYTAAVLHLHLGTEYEQAWQWASGDIPPGYDPLDSDTWPVTNDGADPYYAFPTKPATGEWTIENIEGHCDGCGETSNILPTI